MQLLNLLLQSDYCRLHVIGRFVKLVSKKMQHNSQIYFIFKSKTRCSLPMNKLYFFGGLLLLFISIAGGLGLKDDFKVKRYGSLVNMKIIHKPGSCLGTKVKWFMKVEYNGKVFSKQITGYYCENHTIGQVIQLVYLPGNNSVLFPGEPNMPDVISFIFLLFFGLLISVYGLFKSKIGEYHRLKFTSLKGKKVTFLQRTGKK